MPRQRGRPWVGRRRPAYKVSFLGGRVPLDLRFRGPLEAKSFVRGRNSDPPGAPGRVFDLKCRSCGYVCRCRTYGMNLDFRFGARAENGHEMALELVSGSDFR